MFSLTSRGFSLDLRSQHPTTTFSMPWAKMFPFHTPWRWGEGTLRHWWWERKLVNTFWTRDRQCTLKYYTHRLWPSPAHVRTGHRDIEMRTFIMIKCPVRDDWLHYGMTISSRENPNLGVRLSSQFHSIFKWHHVGSLKLTEVRICEPQELTVPPTRASLHATRSWLLNIYQHATGFNHVLGILCRC